MISHWMCHQAMGVGVHFTVSWSTGGILQTNPLLLGALKSLRVSLVILSRLWDCLFWRRDCKLATQGRLHLYLPSWRFLAHMVPLGLQPLDGGSTVCRSQTTHASGTKLLCGWDGRCPSSKLPKQLCSPWETVPISSPLLATKLQARIHIELKWVNCTAFGLLEKVATLLLGPSCISSSRSSLNFRMGLCSPFPKAYSLLMLMTDEDQLWMMEGPYSDSRLSK